MCDLEDLGIKKCGFSCAAQCRHKNSNYDEKNDFTFVNDNKTIKVDYGTSQTWYRAYVLDDVFKAMANGEYKLVAGNTGQGISVIIMVIIFNMISFAKTFSWLKINCTVNRLELNRTLWKT